jgi:2',3'-cyclic-nucleotide 2'-phosphodiesterase (5'-nucleotidase family)
MFNTRMMMTIKDWGSLWLGLGLWLVPMAASAATQPVTLTLLHTNDLHSQFRSDRSPLQLGGVARLSTAIQEARAANPASLLLDGGDWSEGRIYYVEGAGAESLKMMSALTYDVAVVGNHDWLNQPKWLLSAIGTANASAEPGPRMELVGANFDVSAYDRADEFRKAIPRYAVRELSGVKIGIIGLVNHEEIYGGYLAPVKTTDPAESAAELASWLKSEKLADVVVGVSHNRISVNEEILQIATDLDLIIGGHDHRALTREVLVERPGHPDAWIVEAGHHGQFLGQLRLDYRPSAGGKPSSLRIRDYRLRQIDRSVPEDPRIVAKVEALEARIEAKMGPIFHDLVAHCEFDVGGQGIESPVGGLVTDAYARATGADIAIDQGKLIYGGLEEGPARSVDFFNLLAAIHNPETGKSWTIHTWTMPGATVALVFRLIYSIKQIADFGGLELSGLEVLFDPLKQQGFLSLQRSLGLNGSAPFAPRPAWSVLEDDSPIHSLTLRGKPIDPTRTYKLAASTGVITAIRMINEKFFDIIPLNELTDTGVESWRIARDYAREISPITPDKIGFGNRVRTWQADLGIVPGSMRWAPIASQADGSILARVDLTVRNFGGNESPAGAKIGLESNLRGYDESVAPQWMPRGQKIALPALKPGEARSLSWAEVSVPGDRGIYPLKASIETDGETHAINDSMIRYFAP